MNNTWKIYMLSLINFLIGTIQFVITGILDKIAASVGISISAAGQLNTVFALAGAIGTPLVMMGTSKLDRRKQLLLSLGIIFIGVVMTVTLPGYAFLMTSRIVLGVGSGVFVVTAYALVAKLAQPERRARAMSNLALGSSASLVIGVPISRVIASVFDWQVIFWGIGLLILIAIFAVVLTIPAAKSEVPIPLNAQLAYLKKPRITFALCVTFFMFISYSMVNTYVAPFLSSTLPKMEGQISIILSALGISCVIGSKLGGFLADRFGAAHTLVSSMVVQALVLVLLSIVPSTAIAIIPLLMLWATAAWITGPTLNFNLVSLAPEASGIMLSLNSSFVQFGFAAGAGIGGIAVKGAAITAITWGGAVSVGVAAIVAAISFGRTKLVLKTEKQLSQEL
jgi:MFS transporter, DHA1 family, putative efflux transporter